MLFVYLCKLHYMYNPDLMISLGWETPTMTSSLAWLDEPLSTYSSNAVYIRAGVANVSPE